METTKPLEKLMQQQSLNPKKDFSNLPELTEEEIESVLLAARKNKAILEARASYQKKIAEEPEKEELTPEQLSQRVRTGFEALEGRPFILDQNNRAIFESLCQYFTGNSGNLDLKKGIMLWGNVGVGKTEVMRMFRSNPYASHGIISCRQVVDSFINMGTDKDKAEQLVRYFHPRKASKPNQYHQDWMGTCFDDLGTEQIPAMHYGNSKNVMAEVILNRYDNRLPYFATHITTNLDAYQLKETYGTRVYDRIMQMFNVVEFTQIESRRV